jgi:hypothetical protein
MNYPAAELRGIKMNFHLINPDAEHRGILLIKKEALRGRLVQFDGDKQVTLSGFKDAFFARHANIDDDTVAAYDLARGSVNTFSSTYHGYTND